MRTKYFTNDRNSNLKRIKNGRVEIRLKHDKNWDTSMFTVNELNSLSPYSCIRQISRDEARKLFPKIFKA